MNVFLILDSNIGEYKSNVRGVISVTACTRMLFSEIWTTLPFYLPANKNMLSQLWNNITFQVQFEWNKHQCASCPRRFKGEHTFKRWHNMCSHFLLRTWNNLAPPMFERVRQRINETRGVFLRWVPRKFGVHIDEAATALRRCLAKLSYGCHIWISPGNTDRDFVNTSTADVLEALMNSGEYQKSRSYTWNWTKWDSMLLSRLAPWNNKNHHLERRVVYGWVLVAVFTSEYEGSEHSPSKSAGNSDIQAIETVKK